MPAEYLICQSVRWSVKSFSWGGRHDGNARGVSVLPEHCAVGSDCLHLSLGGVVWT